MNSIRLLPGRPTRRLLVFLGVLLVVAGFLSPTSQAQEPPKDQAKTAAKSKVQAKVEPEKRPEDKKKEVNLLIDIKQRPKVYRLGPSDIINVLVWKEDNLSQGKLLVRPDGRISLPLLDDILAEGRTPMQLKNEITEKLKRYVEAPRVFITVADPRSHFFCVLGHVKTPGQYAMLSPTTVLQALAQAGGFDEWADEDNIKIIRGTGDEQQVMLFDYSDVVSGDNIHENVLLKPGDVIVVP